LIQSWVVIFGLSIFTGKIEPVVVSELVDVRIQLISGTEFREPLIELLKGVKHELLDVVVGKNVYLKNVG
jgi:hypothetical protein